MADKRFNDYDPFAWAYNKHWGDLSHTSMPILEKILFSKLTESALVLDLCCGAGQTVGALLERKYNAVGLDGSEKLLEFAQKNVPKGKFVLADARYFKINKQFDAVISLFDSLNHIMSIEDMSTVFRSVFAHLKPGGLFVFDLNIEQGFNERWKSGSSSIIEPDNVVAVKTEYDSDQKVGRFDASIFKQKHDGAWERTDVKLLQKCYAEEEICFELNRVGFKQIKTIDTYSEFDGAAKGRPFFCGLKSKDG